jgi:hypothetical protein
MTVRPLQSAWRFSHNELSGKPGAVQGRVATALYVALQAVVTLLILVGRQEDRTGLKPVTYAHVRTP